MAKNKESAEDKLYNLQAQQLAAQVANWAATLEFQKTRFQLLEMPQFQQGMQLEVDKLAWEKAQDTWERAYQEAAITGTYQGQPTTQWLMDQARLTGSFNGQQTLEGKLTDAQVQDMHDKMNLANAQFLTATTGYLNGQKTFDREKFEAAQALEGWKFIATLSGPQNAFKQARAIASAPGGMTQLMDAFAGQYMLPSSSAVGSGGAGGGDPNGQLNDMRMGWGGMSPEGASQPVPSGGAFVPPYSTPQYNPTQYGPQAPFVPVAPYVTPAPTTPTPTTPTTPAPPFSWFNPIPRPSDPDYAETTARWNSAHPGYALDSSPIGFHAIGTAPMPNTGGQYPEIDAMTAAPQTQVTEPVYVPQPFPTTPVPGDPRYPSGGVTPPGQTQAAGYMYTPPGVQAPGGAYNYSGTGTGEVQVYPPGVYSPAQTADVSSYAPMAPGSVSPTVNQPYQYAGAVTAPVSGGGIVNPNQINARNYDNSYQYQKDLLWANYEDQGWDKALAQESYLKSLPKYGGVSRGSVAF